MPKPQAIVSVTVSGAPDTELFVINHALRLVTRGPLPWSGQLPGGVYKFKFRRGTAIKEQTVLVDPAQPSLSITAPSIKTASAVPMTASSRSHEYHMAAAYEHSRKADRTLGHGGAVFILVRDWTRRDDPVRSEQPAKGLRLCDANGEVVADLEREASTGGQGKDDRWAVMNLGVAPGTYRLRLDLSHGSLEQSIVVCDQWQTQVYLLLDNYGTRAEPDWRADVARASVLMAQLGRGFTPDDEEFRLTDTALSWLAARQQNTAGEALKRALNAKYRNPMLGLYAAHALIGGRSRAAVTASGDFNQSFCASAVENLWQIVPGHPDAAALQMWLTDGASPAVAPIAMPPMLASSWSMIVEASAKRPSLLARGSLASRVGASLWGGGPWLIWTPVESTEGRDPAAPEFDIAFLIEGLTSVSGGTVKQLEESMPDLTDVQRAMLHRSKRARSPEELVRSTGVPLETLQNAAIDLAMKFDQKYPKKPPQP